jgi:hypothetical protein
LPPVVVARTASGPTTHPTSDETNSTLVLPVRQGDASPASAHDSTLGLEVGLRSGLGTAPSAGLGETAAGGDEVSGVAECAPAGRSETDGAQAATTSPMPRTTITPNRATVRVQRRVPAEVTAPGRRQPAKTLLI